jgi:hypothetical protein
MQHRFPSSASETSHQLIASKLTNLVLTRPSHDLTLLQSSILARFADTLVALRQQQIAAIFDCDLGYFGKALQQPGQRDLQPDVIFRNVEMTGCRLSERAHAKDHAITLPSLFIDLQHRHALRRARQSHPETAARLLAAEAMRDGDDKRFGHVRNPYLLQACKAASSGKKRATKSIVQKLELSKFRLVLVRKAEQCAGCHGEETTMSIGTIILIILVIALLGGFSGIGGGPFYGTGYYGGGGLGLIVVILLILLLLGRI